MTAESLTRRFVVLRGLRWFPVGVILPFAILLPQARGLSLPAIGALWAIHSAVILVLEVPSGAMADTFGRRRVLLAGSSLMAVGIGLYAIAEREAVFAVALAALAAGRAMVSGGVEAWYVDALRAADPAASLRPGLSRGTVADGAGMAVGALAGGFLPHAFAGLPAEGGGLLFYSPVALIAAGAAAGYVVAIALLVHEPPRPRVRFRSGFGDVVREAAAGVRESLVVRTVLLSTVAFGVALVSVELLWQPRLAEILGDAEDHSALFGLLVASSMAVLALGAAVSPRLIGRLGARRGYIAHLALVAVAIGALALAGSVAAFIVAYLALYAMLGLGDPVHYELLHEATDDAVRATVLSAESLAGQAGAGVGNLTMAAIAGASGIPFAWTVAAGIMALAALLTLRLPRVLEPRPRSVGARAG